MSDSSYPSQTQDKFIVRLPDGMRDRIKAAAEANNRSMNAEIVSVLEAAFPDPDKLPHKRTVLSEEMLADLAALLKKHTGVEF